MYTKDIPDMSMPITHILFSLIVYFTLKTRVRTPKTNEITHITLRKIKEIPPFTMNSKNNPHPNNGITKTTIEIRRRFIFFPLNTIHDVHIFNDTSIYLSLGTEPLAFNKNISICFSIAVSSCKQQPSIPV